VKNTSPRSNEGREVFTKILHADQTTQPTNGDEAKIKKRTQKDGKKHRGTQETFFMRPGTS
jgi:hypothetical protein